MQKSEYVQEITDRFHKRVVQAGDEIPDEHYNG